MPEIHPFKGLRYDPEKVGDLQSVVAPPYDIVYDEWREDLYKRSPYNIIRLIKTKDEPGDNDRINRYTRARDYLKTWMRDGVLRMEEKPALYVRADTYQVNGETKTRYGFIALVRLEEFGHSIHPHERTLAAPKIDRLNLIKATGTNLSQIFSTFFDPGHEIQDILLTIARKEPDFAFTDCQGIGRKMWLVYDEDIIARIQELMKNRDLIIADGHHRYETSLEYRNYMEHTRLHDNEPFDYVTMYFSSANADGMTILPTHRKVGGLEHYDETRFFASLEEEFEISPCMRASLDEILDRIREDSDLTNVFGIFTGACYSMVKLRHPTSPKQLDVDVLHDSIIEKKLGITRQDIAEGRYIHFCKSPEHAYDDVNNGTDQLSFFMNALTPEELFREVLEKGIRMPQKSTYFYPKTMSGLVMYKLDRESLGG